MKKLSAIVIGYGMRARVYTNYFLEHPEKFEVSAVADKSEIARDFAKERHNLTNEQLFDDWKELCKKQ